MLEASPDADSLDLLLDYALAMRRRVDLLVDALGEALVELGDGERWDEVQELFVICASDPFDEDLEDWIKVRWAALMAPGVRPTPP